MDNINLVDKVYGIMAERTELSRLIHEFVIENGLEDSFHEHLMKSEASDEYRDLDLNHMALDYIGGGDEKKEQLTNRDLSFIYSPHLAAYIEQNGVQALTIALNPRNMNKFSLFANSDKLSKLINEYKTTK